MFRKVLACGALALAPVFLSISPIHAAPLGTEFSYQGRLTDNGSLGNGSFDFEFRLWTDPVDGVQAGPTQTLLAETVTFGLFNVQLDLGPAFQGDAFWLETSMRPAGGGAYTTLAPRVQLVPVPNAFYAERAGIALNDADISPTNEIQSLSNTPTGTDVTVNISGGTGTTFSIDDGDWAIFSGSGLSAEINHAGDVALGTFTDPDGHGLNVQNYEFGKAAVRGANETFSNFFAEGMLGVLDPAGTWAIPLGLYNIGVLGVKSNLGGEGAAVYGWSNDDNPSNYGGVFISNGTAPGGTNYGVYGSATNGTTNWAGYFAGNVHATGVISGDGSGLTNINGGGFVLASNLGPSADDFASGVIAPALTGDDVIIDVAIPFTVTYKGVSYSSVEISTNGWVELGSGLGSPNNVNDCLPTSSHAGPFIAAYWDDLIPQAPGFVTWKTVGSLPNRVFQIKYDVVTFIGNYPLDFTISIHEMSGLIDVRYYSVAPASRGQDATIGFQTAGGIASVAYPISCYGTVLDDNSDDTDPSDQGWSISPIR